VQYHRLHKNYDIKLIELWRLMMRVIQFFVISLSLLWHIQAAASPEWHQSVQTLPPYCKDKAASTGLDDPRFSKWRGPLGTAFVHIHHYCSGIYAEQKARSTIDQVARNRSLKGVAGEMAYVARFCNAKCTLYPELQTRWGWALAMQDQPGEAIQHYQLAIKAKPDYSKAYAQMSDLYVKINQPNEARKVIEAGLKAKPNSRMLQRRLQKLK
jgi:tetratricopeptide (TPR) repeat protein